MGRKRTLRGLLFLEHSVAVVDPRAGELGDRQHPLIVLEDPAELADLDSELRHHLPAGGFDQHEGERAGEAGAGVDKWARGEEKASDHAPTWVELG